MYVEWRHMLNTGIPRCQDASIALEAETKLFRWYEPGLYAKAFGALADAALHDRATKDPIAARLDNLRGA